jgi:acyl-CoA reductase-like NAD-dependent aldehyde dehydrogenase
MEIVRMSNIIESPTSGKVAQTATRAQLAIANPATDEQIAEVTLSNASDVNAVVSAAVHAQKIWAAQSTSVRADALFKFSEVLDQNADAIMALDIANIGKAMRDARAEKLQLGRIARHWAGAVDKILGQQIPTAEGELTFTRRLPVGVVAAITPWNAPGISTVQRIAPALACGNASIVKPSEMTPLSPRLIAELAVEAGLPDGLVSVIVGDGKAGHALASHPSVGAVRFTGGIATGRHIAHAAADTFKKVTLELGGKSPNIVFADADIERAARGSVWGVFSNAGQICCAGTRLLVEDSIADEFVERLRVLASRIRVGNPLDDTNHIGPLAFRRHYERVLEYIDIGKGDGAKVISGGGRPSLLGSAGCYISPTIFDHVAPNARIAQEEVFGPVLAVIRFTSEEQALEIANGTVHGLASIVWTQDLNRGLRMSDGIDAGNVWINTGRAYGSTLPFSGFKSSGVGNAMSEGAIEGCTRVKRITIAYGAAGNTPGWDDISDAGMGNEALRGGGSESFYR